MAISLCNEIDYNLHILHMISILRDVIRPDSDLRDKNRDGERERKSSFPWQPRIAITNHIHNVVHSHMYNENIFHKNREISVLMMKKKQQG